VVPPRHLNNNNLPSDPPPDKPKREDFPTPEAYEAALQKWMITTPPPRRPVSNAPVPSEAGQSPVDSGVTSEVRKRGRPSEIPADRKKEVAKLMADAAARDEKFPRKEAAKILYTTNKPTASQRRNAGNIMKYYLKSRDKN
jgi:hypothetical protein